MIPPSRKAKEKAAEKTPQNIILPRKGKTHFEKVFYGDEVTEDSSQESDVSDYRGRPMKRKKKYKVKGRKTKRKKGSLLRRSPTPEAPEMSDKDVDGESVEDDEPNETTAKTTATIRRQSSIPSTLRLDIRGGVTAVNIDLARYLQQYEMSHVNTTGGTSEESTLVNSNFTSSGTSLEGTSTLDLAEGMRSDPTRACFLDLQPEVRNRIYRLSLVMADPISFSPAKNTARTAPLLQTCQQIHREASEILYGENSFHFARVISERGRYHDKVWEEVGYKDVRRFLTDIGPLNRSYMRYISLSLSDTMQARARRLDLGDRRYADDPIVHQVLNLISSSGAILEEFVVGFAGKQNINGADFHFLRTFTRIRCRQLTNTSAFGHSRIQDGLFDKMRDVMEVPTPDNIDEKKKKKRVAKMIHEKPTMQDFNKFKW